MQYSRIVSKSRRRELFENSLPEITPPCGCVPTLIECNCQHKACEHEIDVEFINSQSGKPCECGWEDDAIIKRLGALLARLDPHNYGQPPMPRTPIITISSQLRIDIMQVRDDAGFALYHPDDRSADAGREGELVKKIGFGVRKRHGFGSGDNSRHDAKKGGERKRRVYKIHCPMEVLS